MRNLCQYRHQWGRFRPSYPKQALMFVFPLPSQVNLCLISMERLHYLIRIWFYCRSIMSSLLMTFIVASAMVCSGFRRFTSRVLAHTRYTDCAFSHFCRSFSYHGYYRNPCGSILKDRKLAITIFIATGVSVVTILPFAIFFFLPVVA